MFELSDEDDNFWDDVPLGDITNVKPGEGDVKTVQNVLRKPNEVTTNPAKRQCVGEAVPKAARETMNIPDPQSTAEKEPMGEQGPVRTTIAENSTPLMTKPSRNSVEDQPVGNIAAVRERIITSTKDKVTPESTPRRPKRKFPGPAGLLPKLHPGQSMDSVTELGVTRSDPDKGNKEDTMILSSQSSDDVFLDSPWQTLLHDLEEESTQFMKKFSIATIPLKAGKKQLMKGKVPMVFAVIESLDTHGSDASVTLRDKTGRIQGTVHRDLLKDYEAELQPGTVVVLRQVSVISLTNKNHYLNITPSNIVVMYQNKNSQLQKVKFHGSQDSLHSILVSLEKKSFQDSKEGSSTNGTPNSSNSSRLTSRNSSSSTPVLSNTMPNQTIPRYPAFSGANFIPRPSGVRDVSFTPRPLGVRDVSFTPRPPEVRDVSFTPRPLGVRDVSFTPRPPEVRDVSFTPRTPGVRDFRFTPRGMSTICINQGQNALQQTTPLSCERTPNPQMGSINCRANSQTGMGMKQVPRSSGVRANFITGSSTTPDSNSPVQNTSSFETDITPGQGDISMTKTCSSGVNSCFRQQNSNVISTSEQSTVASLSASGKNNHASKPNVVTHTSDKKLSPESNNNKRKWSFKSPASSPNVSGAQVNSSKNMFNNISQRLGSETPRVSTGSLCENLNAHSNSINQINVPSIGIETKLKHSVSFNATYNRQNRTESSIFSTSNNEQHISGQQTFHERSEDLNNNKSVSDETAKTSLSSAANNNVSRVNGQIPTETVPKSKWSFKSRTVTSPAVTKKLSPPTAGQNGSPGASGINQKMEELWQDDLSDELLSQLSDDLM